MKLKIYERTGIKEENQKKIGMEETLKLQKQEQKIQKAMARGIYKKNCKNNYDVEKMSYEKEYKKTRSLLNRYNDSKRFYSEGIQVLFMGYMEHFNIYSKSMTPLQLRVFRKNMESTMNKAFRIEIECKQENKLIDLCIEYLEFMENYKVEENDSMIECDLLYIASQVSKEDDNELETLKIKAKSIYEILKR